MKNLSLKMDESVYDETEKVLKRTRKTRNRYINEAVDFYNKLHRRRDLAKELMKESQLVSAETIKVLAELEAME
jgi:hypothetical protein